MSIDVLVPTAKVIFISFMSYHIGFIYAILLFFAIYFALIKVAELGLGIELVSVYDSLYFNEHHGSPNVIQTMVIIEKMEYNSFKKLITHKAIQNYIRLRQKVDKYFNEVFWREVSIDEAQENIRTFPSEMKTLETILNFLEYEFSKPLALSRPQWEIFYKENFNETQSMFVFKHHQALGDGVSLLNLFSGLCENYNLNDLNSRVIKVSLVKKILLSVLSPYYIFAILPTFKKDDNNPLENFSNKFSGENRLVMTKPFAFAELKKVYKKYDNCTFNDLAWTLVSRAVDNYSKSTIKNTKSNTIIGTIGVSFRTELVPYELGNSSASTMVRLVTKEDFNDGIRDVRDALKPYKSKASMIGASYFLWFIGRLFLNDSLVKRSSDKPGETSETSFEKVCFSLTNLPGPVDKNLNIAGKKVFDIIPFVAHGNLSFSVIAFSYGDQVRFNFHADKVYGPDIAQIAENLEKEISELVKIK